MSSLLSNRNHSPHSSTLPVAEAYERWALTYDQSPNPLLAREERYLLPLLPSLDGRRVLDLACGTGRWLERFREAEAQVVGVDYSKAMLSVARAKPGLEGQLARADCLELPFPTAVFDYAICSFAISHFRFLEDAIRELARVMKPSSLVWISDLHPEAHKRGWRTIFKDQTCAWQIQTWPKSVRELASTYRSGGFETIKQESLYLGQSERPIFERANRTHVFAGACTVPAIIVWHLRRSSATLSRGTWT